MNTLEMLLSKPLIQALGWALVHFIWQGALIALLYAGLAAALRQRAANLRYAVACAAMLLMLLLPVVTVFIIAPAMSQTPSEALMRQPTVYSPTDASLEGRRQAGASEATPPVGFGASQSVPVATTQAVAPASADAPLSSWRLWARQRFVSLMPWLVAVWFAGVLFLSFRFLGGLFIAQRLKRREAGPLLEQWQATLAELCERLRVSRPVRLCESVLVEVPTVIGWLRPVILVPASALTGLSAAQLEALLAHELGHIKRYDYLVNLLQTAVETLLFYHPAVWWLSSQIRQEREHCCDDLAVATCGNVLVYARALAELEQMRGVAPQLAVAASGGVLLRRIQRLVGNPARPSHRFESWLAGVIALAMVCGLLAGAQARIFSGEITKGAADDSSSASVAKATDNTDRRATAAAQKPLEAAHETKAETVESQSEQQSESTVTVETQTREQAEQQSESGTDLLSGLAAEGYSNLSVDDVVAFKIHGVTPAFIHEMNALFNKKLQADDLVAFRIHGVTPQFMSEMKAAGLGNLSPDDLVAFRIHGVTTEFMSEWKAAGYDHLSADDLVAFRIHGVTPAFVQEVKGLGFDHISPDDLVAFRIHGVTSAFVQTMRGYIRGNLSADDLTAMRIHGVTPEFIKEIEAAGYANLSADDLVAFRIHGVTPSFIKTIQTLGYKPTADQLVELRVHNVSSEFIETVKSRGFKDATLEQIIELRRLNIVPGPRKQ